MKKLLALIAALATAAAIGLSTSGSSTAATASTCSATSYGFGWSHAPNQFSVNYYGTLNEADAAIHGGSGSSVRVRIAANGNGTLEVGIRDTGGGPVGFIENNGTDYYTHTVPKNNSVTAEIAYISGTTYSVSITGPGGAWSHTSSLSQPNVGSIAVEGRSKQVVAGTCNYINGGGHFEAPWNLTEMTHYNATPYSSTPTGGNFFVVAGS